MPSKLVQFTVIFATASRNNTVSDIIATAGNGDWFIAVTVRNSATS